MCAELRKNALELQFGMSELQIHEFCVHDINDILMELMHLGDNWNSSNTRELAEICHRRTHGNAFFLVMFLRELCSTNLLSFNIGSYQWDWDPAKIIAQTSATENVVEFMKNILQTLPTGVQKRLSVAAYLGNVLKPKTLNLLWSHISFTANDDDSVKTTGTSTSSDQNGDSANHFPVVDREAGELIGPGEVRVENGRSSNALDMFGNDSNLDSQSSVIKIMDRTDIGKDMDESPTDGTWLRIAQKKGLVERLKGETSTEYRWVHDKVQEAAMSLVAAEDLPALKKEIGETLLSQLDSNDLDSHIFVIVNLINEAEGEEGDARLELASLNQLAATKAARCCAFEAAAKYANQGITLLPDDRWINHRALSLELFSTAIESEHRCGLIGQMKRHYDEFVAQDFDVLEKMRAHTPMIDVHFADSADGWQKAQDLVLDLLAEYGLKLPKRTFPIVLSMLSLVKLKRQFTKMKVSDILKLPLTNDREHLEVVKLLSRLGTISYRGDKTYMVLAVLENAKLIMKVGITELSPSVLPQLGFLFSLIWKDFRLGYKCGEMAMQLLSKYNFRDAVPQTIMMNILNAAFLDPLIRLDTSLKKAYRIGTSIGDTHHAMICAYQRIPVQLAIGSSLDRVERDCRKYCAQMAEFDLVNLLPQNIAYWLASIQLMGKEDTALPVQGISATTTLIDWADKHKDDALLVATTQLLRSHLHAIYGEDEDGAELAIIKGDAYVKANPGHFCHFIDTFVKAVCLYTAARKMKRKKYLVHARKLHSNIKGWVQKGNPNVVHYEKFLNAEEAALEGDQPLAEGWYQAAALLALRNSFHGDAALINERYGEFLLDDCHNVGEATVRLAESIRLYREWGADRKVSQLEHKHAELWPRPEEIVM
uniref:Uncharacterized protein n=1 Tax=Entomoneis paludosa TaxID=265537 RepID=A0A7S3DWV0_9STRA